MVCCFSRPESREWVWRVREGGNGPESPGWPPDHLLLAVTISSSSVSPSSLWPEQKLLQKLNNLPARWRQARQAELVKMYNETFWCAILSAKLSMPSCMKILMINNPGERLPSQNEASKKRRILCQTWLRVWGRSTQRGRPALRPSRTDGPSDMAPVTDHGNLPLTPLYTLNIQRRDLDYPAR